MLEDINITNPRWKEIQDLKNEIWKPLKDFEEYEISNYGRIKHYNKFGRKNEKIKIIGSKKTNNYCYARIEGKSRLIHRLVAQTFLENLQNKPQINHINGKPYDNRVCNLEYCTQSENQRHAYKIGLQTVDKEHLKKLSKLCANATSKKVCKYDLKGNLLQEFKSVSDASRSINKNHSLISMCCSNKKGHKTAGGFVWKYKEE